MVVNDIMGRLLKNQQIVTGSNAIRVPVGNTGDRPQVPVNGQIRFNTDTSRFEIYYNAWKEIAINGTAKIVKDLFTGDGIQTSFNMSQIPVSAETILVFVGNVHQNPNDSFSLSGAVINFFNAPPPGQSIVIFHNFGSTDANYN